MAIQITCITKAGGYHEDPHQAIERVGWVNPADGKTGNNSRLEIYAWIKNEGGTAFVSDARGNKAYVAARENARGTLYLQTYADTVWTNNLLSLPECR